jgi:hypothetical protein
MCMREHVVTLIWCVLYVRQWTCMQNTFASTRKSIITRTRANSCVCCTFTRAHAHARTHTYTQYVCTHTQNERESGVCVCLVTLGRDTNANWCFTRMNAIVRCMWNDESAKQISFDWGPSHALRIEQWCLFVYRMHHEPCGQACFSPPDSWRQLLYEWRNNYMEPRGVAPKSRCFLRRLGTAQ